MSHVQLAAGPDRLHAARLDTGGASLVVGCDLVVTASADAVAKMNPAQTRAVVNGTVTPTAEFVRNPNWRLPGSDLQRDLAESCRSAEFVAASEIASALMGDAIATNMFMLGYAYQKGWVPLEAASLERAIELNGVSVDFNRKSFVWGRRAAVDLERVRRIAMPAEVIQIDQHFSRNLDELVERRSKLLTEYQDAAYARRYVSLIEKVRDQEKQKAGSSLLAEAVAKNYAKLLAYKDEYEVARLHADAAFRGKIEGMFEGDYKVVYHLAPPLLARRDPLTGEPRKMRFGSWMGGVFSVLKSLKGLRGTALDVFGYTAERRMERDLIREYEATVETLLAGLDAGKHALAVEIASLPEEMRGFGHIKARNVAATRKKVEALLAQYRAAPSAQRAAA
jgi:indolepyruvate ferredoxin oxidoreductase